MLHAGSRSECPKRACVVHQPAALGGTSTPVARLLQSQARTPSRQPPYTTPVEEVLRGPATGTDALPVAVNQFEQPLLVVGRERASAGFLFGVANLHMESVPLRSVRI